MARRLARLGGRDPTPTPEASTKNEQNGIGGSALGPRIAGADAALGIWTAFEKFMEFQQGMMTQNQQQTAAVVQALGNGRPEPGAKQFHELHPKTFSGLGGPLEAEEWVRSTESKLSAARIPQAGWVEVAQLQLTDNACTWWETQEKSMMSVTTVKIRANFGRLHSR